VLEHHPPDHRVDDLLAARAPLRATSCFFQARQNSEADLAEAAMGAEREALAA